MTKSILSTFTILGISATAAFAGPMSSGKGGATPALNVPAVCDCFEANSLSFSTYAGGMISNGGAGNGGESLDDAFAAGIALDYFFTQNVGLEADATFITTSSEISLVTGSVVVRAPVKSACFAPFVLAGGGIHADGVTQGVWHAGGGLDLRLANCWGIFADARYTWAEDSDNYTLLRGGVRFSF